MVKVLVPTPLRSYTANRPVVEAAGTTFQQISRDLDRQFPGIRFRMIDEQDHLRPHIKVFRNAEQLFDLDAPLIPSDEIAIIQAFSGG